MTHEERKAFKDLARRWLDKAIEHEQAAEERPRDPDADMHDEARRVYRECADDLCELL